MSFSWPALEADRKGTLFALIVGALGIVLVAILTIWSFASIEAGRIPLATHDMNDALAAWGLRVEDLLLIMPFGACVILFTRTILGVDTFGIYTPMLLSLAFIQLGPLMGPLIVGSAILVGIVTGPLIDKLHLSRIGFMGVMIGVVVLTLVAFQTLIGGGLWVTAYPVVVSALVVERWYTALESDGSREALTLTLSTFIIAIVTQFAMVSPLTRWLVELGPFLLPGLAVPVAILLARYRGLRLSEIWRFRKVLERPDERAWYEPAQRPDREG